MRRLLIAAIALSLSSPLKAQDPAPGAAPSLFPEGYLDHDALTAALNRLVEQHPGAVRLASLGQSTRGRDLWLVSLGVPADGAAARPAVLVVANLEADHVVGSQVALGLVERLAAAGPDSEAARLLGRVTIHVVPRLNPDGAEVLLRGSPRADVRTNLRPVDRDRDGRAGEDGPDDLDGDGLALRMRVKDGAATLVPDPDDPRILRRADAAKGERAIYSEYPEGLDNDGDGRRDEDPPGGVNLNRNWPHRWTEFDPEAGWSPGAEPETRALIAWIVDHPEVAAVWTFALHDDLANEPKKPGSTLDDADLPFFAELSRRYRHARSGAAPGGDDPESQEGRRPPRPAIVPGLEGTTDGALSEWAYHQLGAVGLSSRLWAGPELPEPAEGEPKPPEDGQARWLAWNDRVMGGRAFVPFRAFDHPALGPVEIGGWRPGVRLNPPVEALGPLADEHFAFLVDLAGRLPSLEIADVKVEPKGGRLFAVTASVVNAGFLPTALAQGVKTRYAAPVVVRLDAGGATLLAGRSLEKVEALGGSGGRREFRWLLDAPDGLDRVTLEARTPRAGRASRVIELK